jgi:coenzyme PQQ precursor peptide PqqA
VSDAVNNETIGDWQLSGTRGRPRAVLLQTCHRPAAGALLQNNTSEETEMAWTRPKLREICIGMEINGYFAGTL